MKNTFFCSKQISWYCTQTNILLCCTLWYYYFNILFSNIENIGKILVKLDCNRRNISGALNTSETSKEGKKLLLNLRSVFLYELKGVMTS